MTSLPQSFKIVDLLKPATDAAGRTSTVWVSLKNSHRAWLLFHIAQGNAATCLLTPLQASAVAGTGSKALTNSCPVWANLDTATSDALAAVAAAKNYTTDAGVANKLICFEISPALHMDIANGFDCIGCSTGASDIANLTSAIVLLEERFPGTLPPTSIAD